MTTVQCKIDIPAMKGLADQELSVGREFFLICQGEFPANFEIEKAQFVLSPQEKYQIHLLGFEFRSPTEAELKVTSYKAVPTRFQDLQLSDGSQTLHLGAVDFTVTSVLPAPEPGQPTTKQEPYGPVGPAKLPVPMVYWAILAAGIGLVLLLLATRIYRVVQRRSMLERLKEHDSAMTPLSQLHQSLRRMQRTNSVFFGGTVAATDVHDSMIQMDQMFRLFLTRQFHVPALEWNDRLILRDIKKYHGKVFFEYGADLKKLLKEFGRGLQDKEKLKSTDVLNLAQTMRILAEKMERSL